MDIQPTSVIVTFTVTAAALVLACYFAFKRKLLWAAVSMVCFLALFNPTTAMSAELCKPIRYADGDTFTFVRNGEKVRVRLAGYDAPEIGQPFSRRATEHLRMLTGGGAQCDCYKSDRYGRSVCTVSTPAGENIASLMLGAGFGCIDPRFEKEADPSDRADARAALENAQKLRLGMWSSPTPQCAAEFRREKRNANGQS